MANRRSSLPVIAVVLRSPTKIGSTIAFPSISTGIYGYPIELAANVAIDSVRTTIAPFVGL